jgi:threonine/homoserine/homoserine lactone efflux protein
MTFASLLLFAFACFVIIIVPGPTVTVIIANSLRGGTRAGLLNVLGTQAGLVPMILIVALGLETVVSVMAEWFFWVKLAGAVYLIWLGINLFRSDGRLADASSANPPRIGYFWQGMFVIWSNPKALLFFGAFLPQFIDPASSAFWQTLLYGFVFMAVATIFDSIYALLAGKVGTALTRHRVRLVEKISGSLLIAGGAWIALLKRA